MKYIVSKIEDANFIPTEIEWQILNPIKNLPLKLPPTVNHFIFCDKYNQPTPLLPNTITHLTFGEEYNQPTQLSNSITHLTFGCVYNQPTQLPKKLTHLTFGHFYNQPIQLSPNITHLTFGWNYNQMTLLPKKITHLTFSFKYNQKTELPNGITHLIFGGRYNQITTFPNSITHLTFSIRYNQPTYLSGDLLHLTLGEFFNKSLFFPENTINIKIEDKVDIKGYNRMSSEDKLCVLLYHNSNGMFNEKILDLLNNKIKLTQRHLYLCISNNNDIDFCLNNDCYLDFNCLILACNQKNTKIIDMCLEKGFELDEKCIRMVTKKIIKMEKEEEYPIGMSEKKMIEHLTEGVYYKMTKREIKKAKKCIKFYKQKYNLPDFRFHFLSQKKNENITV